ncbi:MAG: sulfate permease [Fusobacteriaceae bacterium]|nr:sulfate permease [Fusobacteriaceae bacterium]
MNKNYLPKIFIVLKEGYNKQKFLNDLIAGIIVGIVALPLSIALAIASGVSPEKGLYTAIIGGFAISFFGGSRVQIGGPTGAFVVIIYGIIQKYGYNGLLVATLMAGIMLILFGIFRFGTVIKYIPYPVTVGFTAGIALLIFSSQIKDLLGLNIEKLPAEFIEKMEVIYHNLNSFNYIAFLIGISTIIISILWNKKFKKIPGSLIAIIITTLAVSLFHLPVETIGSQFGSVPNTFEPLQFPDISFKLVKELFYPSLTIALLAGIESLLSAVVADGMIGTKHNSNMELIGQGIANLLTPIFGGIPATGAIARTATNIKSGGRTPFAGIIHALVLLMIMLFLGKLAVLIPMATLAGILAIVAYNMSEINHFIELKDAPKSDGFVLIITFLLTVFSDLTVAIQFGVLASALLFMKRMSDVSESNFVTKRLKEQEKEFISDEFKEMPKDIEIFEINGPLFFGASSFFQDNLNAIETKPKVLILDMEHVPVIDATGIHILEKVITTSLKNGTHPIIVGLNKQPYTAIKKIHLDQKIGKENMCKNITEGIALSKKILLKDLYGEDEELFNML